jgi:hypothetical protein
MADEVDQVEAILRDRLASGHDPMFASVTSDLLGDLGNAIFECRRRGIYSWEQPVLLDAIRLDWIWRLATERTVIAAGEAFVMADFSDDVVGALRWYLRNLREDNIRLSGSLDEQPSVEELLFRHSLFTLPIAQAVMRSSGQGTAMLDRLRTVLGSTGRPSIH